MLLISGGSIIVPSRQRTTRKSLCSPFHFIFAPRDDAPRSDLTQFQVDARQNPANHRKYKHPVDPDGRRLRVQRLPASRPRHGLGSQLRFGLFNPHHGRGRIRFCAYTTPLSQTSTDRALPPPCFTSVLSNPHRRGVGAPLDSLFHFGPLNPHPPRPTCPAGRLPARPAPPPPARRPLRPGPAVPPPGT